jgi:hypothetical protein
MIYPKLYANADGIFQEDLEKLIITVMTMRDKNGLLLALQPSDVFQKWFLDVARPSLPDDAPDMVKENHKQYWGNA